MRRFKRCVKGLPQQKLGKRTLALCWRGCVAALICPPACLIKNKPVCRGADAQHLIAGIEHYRREFRLVSPIAAAGVACAVVIDVRGLSATEGKGFGSFWCGGVIIKCIYTCGQRHIGQATYVCLNGPESLRIAGPYPVEAFHGHAHGAARQAEGYA